MNADELIGVGCLCTTTFTARAAHRTFKLADKFLLSYDAAKTDVAFTMTELVNVMSNTPVLVIGQHSADEFIILYRDKSVIIRRSDLRLVT